MTFDLIQCSLNQPIRIERILHTLEFFRRGPCGRLSGHKIPATVIVGFNGEGIGADALGETDDLFFVKPNEGSNHRNMDGPLGGDQIGKSLRGDLAQTVPCDNRLRFFLSGNQLSEAHHESSIEDDSIGGRRFDRHFSLQVGKGDQIDSGSLTPTAQFSGNLDDFSL